MNLYKTLKMVKTIYEIIPLRNIPENSYKHGIFFFFIIINILAKLLPVQLHPVRGRALPKKGKESLQH